MSAAERAKRSRDELAVTMSGLYPSLVEWAQRVGEGRVSVVRSILAAERSVRKVHGVIVFDAGTRIRWDGTPGPARPGYGGVAGMFSELLGVSNLVPMAALSSEIYLPRRFWAAAIIGEVRLNATVGGSELPAAAGAGSGDI